MIYLPDDWRLITNLPSLDEIELVIMKAVEEAQCNSLSFSGGVDSSLILYYMSKLFPPIQAFTIASSLNHPDAIYAKKIASSFSNVSLQVFVPSEEEVKKAELLGDLPGDVAVRLLYKFARGYTDSMMACDGIDELACGYYEHQKHQDEVTFYNLWSQAYTSHLEPLNRNSGGIKVCLPYLHPSVINTFFRLPISSKVNKNERKIPIMELARRHLPEVVITRRKYGFCNALEDI